MRMILTLDCENDFVVAELEDRLRAGIMEGLERDLAYAIQVHVSETFYGGADLDFLPDWEVKISFDEGTPSANKPVSRMCFKE